MDYSLILNEISNNQVQILELLNSINQSVFLVSIFSCIILLYLVIRNLTKIN